MGDLARGGPNPDRQELIRWPTHPIYTPPRDRVFQVVVVMLGLSIIALALLLAGFAVAGWERLRRFGFFGS